MKYRYHWSFKLLALVLAVISGAALALGCAGLILDDLGYYERSRLNQQYHELDIYCSRAANAVFDRFAWRDTGIEPKLFERFFRWGADVDAVDSLQHDFGYTIRSVNDNGVILDGNPSAEDAAWAYGGTYDVRRGYVTEMPKAEFYPDYEGYVRAEKPYLTLEGEPLPPVKKGVLQVEYYVVSSENSVNPYNVSTKSYEHWQANGADYTIYRMEYTGYESYYVDVFLSEAQVDAMLGDSIAREFIPTFLTEYHDLLVPMVIWGVIGLLAAILWLALAAGRSPHREGVRPAGLNRIPLDLYLMACGAVGLPALLVAGDLLDQVVWYSGSGNYAGTKIEIFFWDCTAMGLAGAALSAMAALFAMACAAQMKEGDGYWLKHSCLGLLWRWGRRCVRGLQRFFRSLYGLLPLCWQWLLVSAGVCLFDLCCLLLAIYAGSVLLLLLGGAVTILAVLYGAWGFGRLLEGAKKMSSGDLHEKIESKHLLGCFGEFAGHLNALGDACMEAAQKQMRSERMKTELITNVSHDIKTPLTSIINYVDILQKSDDEQQRRDCLEVLDRQSQRLKKLIGDLMDMSKASSGSMTVEITPTDVNEAVSQAIGEFSDTLESCGLTVMFRAPAEPVMALCDGRHLWRVLSNCLGNVVKYALTGTRVYVDVLAGEGQVEVSIRNISAQMLGISAEELMERFVRGDSSRNTEGSGLGLNIAKSLMELQGGKLDLVVDGDLFKVVLKLKAA